jgi:hypothetical protein
LKVKLTHIWRDCHAKMHSIWIREYGAPSAIQHTKKSAPKLVSARWGSKRGVEVRLDICGRARFCKVLLEVLSKRIAQDERDPVLIDASAPDTHAPRTNTIIDEVGAETATHHKVVLGKWRKEVFEHASNHVYWLVVKINVVVGATIERFENFMMQTEENFAMGKLASLAAEKAAQFVAEFDNVLDDAEKLEDIFSMCAETPELLPSVNKYFVSLTLCLHSGFSRRIFWPVTKFSAQFLTWLHLHV